MKEDKIYHALIKDIIVIEEFNQLKKIKHHGTSRYEHCCRVSYYSYKYSKMLKLDFKACARAGLLHDFFSSPEDRTKFQRIMSTFTHPKYALKNALSLFELNNMEKNIIRSHMFPVNLYIPKYAEAWLVSFVDKGVAIYEFFRIIKK